MSVSQYPVLKGIGFPVKKYAEWTTLSHKAMSGKEVTLSTSQNPIWHWEFQYTYLTDIGTPPTPLRTLMDFFNQMQGMFNTFFYLDPTDNQVTLEPFGTGDGTTTVFNLLRHLTSGGWAEWIQSPNFVSGASNTIFINGVATTAYTVSSTGQIVFATPPSAAAALTWTGQYFFKCRFETDKSDFSEFMSNLWESQSVKIRSVRL